MDYKEQSIRTDVRIAEGREHIVRTKKAASSARRKTRATPIKKITEQGGAATPADQAKEIIEGWNPKSKTLAGKHWAEIAPIVRELLLAQKIERPQVAYKYIITLSAHTAARLALGHTIAKAEDLFSDEALATSYGANLQGSKRVSVRTSELAFMRAMRATLLPERYGKSKELTQSRRGAVKPYSQSEITELLAYARGRTSHHCIHLHAALLLSLGAGLTAKELMNARGSDLVCTPWGLFIDTQGMKSSGNRIARQVPIRAPFEDELSALAKHFGDELLLGLRPDGRFRDPSTLHPVSSKIPHFVAQRARNNWIREILKNAVPFIALRQAGVTVAADKQLGILSEGLVLEFDRYIQVLRAGEVPFDQSKHEHLIQYAKGQ